MLGSAGFDHGATNDSDAVLRPRRVKKMDPPEPGAEQEAPAAPVDVDVDAAVLLLGAGVTAATHPLLYVKLLIQQVEHLFKRDDLQTSLRKVVKETSHEMIIQCLSRVATHPLHVMSVRCMAQFVGREVKYSGMIRCITSIFKEEGVAGFYVGLMPHMLGELLFLWGCNLLSHLINTYAVDESFSQASAVRSYTKFVMGVAVSVLTYPFMLVADLMAVNNCGLAAGLPPRSPVFKSWLRCWNHLSLKGHLFRGSSLFFRRVPVTSLPSLHD
ncbi:mitochondrial carrier homolog 1-like isoform X3 [Scophthalmus maximus]|uniref:mitochondrial carrier homolog 1-like isoform X3 n=1 Tax=Scophthalmus maximus TaxID=52904 RepID=UPI0015E10A6E|nr:mitochondrial carrier homolog 1-like isoform X3 [Scophthalmus maximus]